MTSWCPNSHKSFLNVTAYCGVVPYVLGTKKVEEQKPITKQKIFSWYRQKEGVEDHRELGRRYNWAESHETDWIVRKRWKTIYTMGSLASWETEKKWSMLSFRKLITCGTVWQRHLLNHFPTGDHWSFLAGLWGLHERMIIKQKLTFFSQPLLSSGNCAKLHSHYLIKSSQ